MTQAEYSAIISRIKIEKKSGDIVEACKSADCSRTTYETAIRTADVSLLSSKQIRVLIEMLKIFNNRRDLIIENTMNTLNFPMSEEKLKAILMAFQNGQHLTTQICCRHYGTTELRKAVCRLRDKGHNIQSYKRDGENFKHYYLVIS